MSQVVNLQIDAVTARKEYSSASPALKAVFEQSFPKGFFSGNIIDRVKTMDDVFIELGMDKEAFYKNCFGLADDEIGYREAKLIAKCLNEGWYPDWDNSSERKWRPWFYMDNPGGFRFFGSYYVNVCTNVGSRLCFKSEELSDYAAKQFIHIYNKFFTA